MFLKLQPLLNGNPLPGRHILSLSLEMHEVRIKVPRIA